MLTHKKYGLNIDLRDFSQAQYETYHAELMKYIGKSTAETNGAVVKAAIRAGFLIGAPEDIGGMAPAAVKWMTEKIDAHVRSVTEPADDPN